jgi:aminoglycoside phosphotransferase (APT) family kinase protein
MEYRWERTFPFLEVSSATIKKLFKGILKECDINNIIPIDSGCRTTNYIVESNNLEKKYILKIFFIKGQDYKKEIKLLNFLRNSKFVPVPEVYRVSEDEDIGNREYAIYEYIEGKTIGQAIREGYSLEDSFVRNVARALAKIHSYKFSKVGALDECLHIREELPPLVSWYESFMGDIAKKRLGKTIVNDINRVVRKNEKALRDLDKDPRLVHGDFQGTNIIIKNKMLAGILDWEFVIAGHPLADIGQFFRYEEYFNRKLIEAFEYEYNKFSDYKLTQNWYNIRKLRDLVNLIQLIGTNEEMPIKHESIKKIIINTLSVFD